MKNRFSINILLIIVSIFSFCYNLNAENSTDSERKTINDLCNNWKEYLGDMDFSDKFLFQRILYLNPQPLDKFKNFTDVKLSNWQQIDYKMWIEKHFKGELLKKLLELKPSKYYLRKTKSDKSLLLYQTEINKSKVMLLENFTVSLITFKPDDFDLAKGIKKAYLENILDKWINIDAKVISKLLNKQIYYKGMVFANNQKRTHILFMGGWQDDIICFLTEKGVSLLLFKASSGRALMGIPTMPDWLDKGKGLIDDKK